MGKEMSRLAYEHTRPSHEAIRIDVWRHIYLETCAGRGCTADDVAAHFEAVHNRTSPRMTELSQMHLIYPNGERRKTRQGCQAAVYIACTNEKLVPYEYWDENNGPKAVEALAKLGIKV